MDSSETLVDAGARLRIRKIEVKGLCELFDHTIELNAAERVTVVHGPNGVGKTAILCLVHALVRGDLSAINLVPFRSLELLLENPSSSGRVTLKLEQPYVGEASARQMLQDFRKCASTYLIQPNALKQRLARLEALPEDFKKKLEILKYPAERIRLFLEFFNRKVRHKKIRIDREQGLVVQGQDGRKLRLDALSSGEQFELTLLHDLLFEVEANALVLIDEPEISLHIEWQRQLLPELLEIAKVAQFDALVATHSPFIVGERSDLMIALSEMRMVKEGTGELLDAAPI